MKTQIVHDGATLDRPTIVCLCGSTRFREAFEEAVKRETIDGSIVLSVGFFHHRDDDAIDPALKDRLDELHKRKIDLADEILVINTDGYVGDSTASEIAHAVLAGKRVRWWEPQSVAKGADRVRDALLDAAFAGLKP